MMETRWSGQFAMVESGVWVESSPNGNQYRYREVQRTQDYIEIDALTGDTRIRIRIYDSRCDFASKPELEGNPDTQVFQVFTRDDPARLLWSMHERWQGG